MKKYKQIWYIILLTSAFMLSTKAYSDMFDGAVVKLYSGGVLVATFNAENGGQIVGSCYIFASESRINEKDKTITVCGTFSVEEKK